MKLKELKKNLFKKLAKKLEEKKKDLAKSLLKEASKPAKPAVKKTPTKEIKAKKPAKPVAKTPAKPAPKAAAKPAAKDDGVGSLTKSQPHPNVYHYQFSFNGRTYVVAFEPSGGVQDYKVYFYAKSGLDSDMPAVRFGIGSPATIQPLFARVLHAIKEFIKVRRPQIIKMVPGKGDIFFPSTYHTYFYEPLKTFETDVEKDYSVQRTSSEDDVAFIMRRGATQSNLKSRSWKPAHHTPAPKKGKKPGEKDDGGMKEDIANVGGANVATDIPFMSKEKLKKNLKK